MPFAEKRPFSLLYSHHTSFLQVTTNSSWREGFVDDVCKWFGKLASIAGLSRIDKMLSMVYVGRRKLGRTTSKRLLEGRAMLFTDPRDSTRTDTSRFSSCIAIFARIKEREDVFDFSSRNRPHDGL
jgi:hypothetical protein